MDSIATVIGTVPSSTAFGQEITLNGNPRVWVSRGLFQADGDPFTSKTLFHKHAAGKWLPVKLELHVLEHDVSDDEYSETSVPYDANPEDMLERSVRSGVPRQRGFSRSIVRRRKNSLLDGRLTFEQRVAPRKFDLNMGRSTRTMSRTEVFLEEIVNVVRFEVPADRSIPFEVDSHNPYSSDDERDSAGSSSLELATSPSSFASVRSMSPVAASGRRAQQVATRQRQRGNTEDHVVYTCGTIGLKWQTSSGDWTFLAFPTTEECYRWTFTLRQVVISQLRFQTFHETFESKLTFSDDLVTKKPNDEDHVNFIVKCIDDGDEQKKDKKSGLPNRGELLIIRDGKPQKWKVTPGKYSDPTKVKSHKGHPQEMHFTRVGSRTLMSDDISDNTVDMRCCSVFTPDPFKEHFYIRVETFHEPPRQLHCVAHALEGRLAWEEFFLKYGATKILSEEEARVAELAKQLVDDEEDRRSDSDMRSSPEITVDDHSRGDATAVSGSFATPTNRHLTMANSFSQVQLPRAIKARPNRLMRVTSPFSWSKNHEGTRTRSNSMTSNSPRPKALSPPQAPSNAASSVSTPTAHEESERVRLASVISETVMTSAEEPKPREASFGSSVEHEIAAVMAEVMPSPEDAQLEPSPMMRSSAVLPSTSAVSRPLPRLTSSASLSGSFIGDDSRRASVNGNTQKPIVEAELATPHDMLLTAAETSLETPIVASDPQAEFQLENSPPPLEATSNSDEPSIAEMVSADQCDPLLQSLDDEVTQLDAAAERSEPKFVSINSLAEPLGSSTSLATEVHSSPDPPMATDVSPDSLSKERKQKQKASDRLVPTPVLKPVVPLQSPERDPFDLTMQFSSLSVKISRDFSDKVRTAPFSFLEGRKMFEDAFPHHRTSPEKGLKMDSKGSVGSTSSEESAVTAAQTVEMGSEDEELLSLQPSLRIALLRNSGGVCPLCNQNKGLFPECLATGRKHVLFRKSSSVVPSKLSEAPNRRMLRRIPESREVIAARILLELNKADGVRTLI